MSQRNDVLCKTEPTKEPETTKTTSHCRQSKIVSKFTCNFCGAKFSLKCNLRFHIHLVHLKIRQKCITLKASAFRNFFEIYNIVGNYPITKPFNRKKLKQKIEEFLSLKIADSPRKWYLTTQICFQKPSSEDELIEIKAYFHSNTHILLQSTKISEQVENACKNLENFISNYVELGSGWVFEKVISLQLNLAKYKPLAAGTYIPLPPALSKKKKLLNIKNRKSSKCFLYCVAAFFHPVLKGRLKKKTSPNSYKQFFSEFETSQLKYPVTLDQIPKFERANNLSINVFGYEKEIFPLYVSPTHGKTRAEIDLLYFSNHRTNHYVLIRDFNSLMFSTSKNKHRLRYCKRCIQKFGSETLLKKHEVLCSQNQVQKITMPEPGSLFKFENIANMQKAEFVVYADFESIISPSTGLHEIHSFAYILINSEGQQIEWQLYRGRNAASIFLKRLFKSAAKVLKEFNEIRPMLLTEENYAFIARTHACQLCQKPLLKHEKVLDHNHLNGKFRKVLCNQCNLAFSLRHKKMLPVFFHNFSKYDSHFILQAVGQFKKKNLNCVAVNTETFISLRVGYIRFMDSFRHLPASLSALVDALKASNHNFPILRQFFPEADLSILTRKQVFCYDFVSHFDTFQIKNLPKKKEFFNSLIDEDISDDDYDHAKLIWHKFKCKNLGDFSDFYLKLDVLLLSEIFENYRKNIFKHYKLEPVFYLTLPSLTLDAALLFSNIEIQLLSDYDKYLFFEKALRGGFSTITKRFSRSNTKSIPEFFDPSKPSKEIVYFDKNNLYGAALREYLPVGGYRWLSKTEIATLRLEQMTSDQKLGYMYEVDLFYPPHLHNYFDEYPPAFQSDIITDEMTSCDTKNLRKSFFKTKQSKVPKLLGTLYTKRNYITHYRNLQLYKKIGIEILKTHRVLEFEQAPIYRDYIDFNSERRRNAKTVTESNETKLLINSLYGKQVENKKNRIEILLACDENQARKIVNKPSFKKFLPINEDLVLLERTKINVILDRPYPCGIVCLELSKVFMYEFFYFYLKPKFGNRVKLLGSDTDSFILEIKTDNLDAELFPDRDTEFDTSNYDKNHPLYSERNKKIVNLMKNEHPVDKIVEWVGLKAKCYSLLFASKADKKIAKGVNRAVIKKHVSHETYRKVLKQKVQVFLNMKNFRSHNHQVYTETLKKLAFCPIDDKRYLLPDGINTKAFGNLQVN